MDRVLYEENLRAEILKFAGGLHPFPGLANNQKLIWDRSFTWDYTEFLKAVLNWDRLDGAAAVGDSTYKKLTDFVDLYLADAEAGQLPIFHLYSKVRVLFVGHPNLFHRFEQLLLMNDGRVETRLQIREWRDYVRQQFLNEIVVEIGDSQSAIRTLKQMPSNLTNRNLEFIQRHTNSPWVMQDLATDGRACEVVLLMEDTLFRFCQMHRFVSQYFAKLSSIDQTKP